MGGTIAAFFDLDGTLYNGHIWAALKRHHETHRVKRGALWVYISVHMSLWPAYKLGLLSRERFYALWAEHMSWLVGGLTLKEAEAVWAWITEQEVLPNLRPEVVEPLRHHQAQGHRVVLVSGTFEPLLAAIGKRLEVTEVVGTRLEVRGGRFTGRAIPPVCLGAGKLARLQEYLTHRGADIDLQASYAYADGEIDLPVLELVGHPVAVYPRPELAEIAAQRGWPVIGESVTA